MRTLMLTDSEVFAGTEGHILELSRQIRLKGIQVLIGCPVPGALAAKARAEGLEVVSIAKKGAFDWRAVLAVRRVCRERGIDIIHSHNGRTAFVAALATRLLGNVRLVNTQHFLTPNRLSRGGVKAIVSRSLHRWVSSKTDRLIAISRASYEGCIARGEASGEKIVVIRNGIGRPGDAVLRPVQVVREELGILADTPLVLCAARLEPEKDVTTLIDAMELVVQKCPGAMCVVAGEGRLRDQLQHQIDSKGLTQSVRLLGFRNDVHSLMNACDLFVLPSLAEPFGLVLLEAMSLAKPVVATAAGGPLEIVQDGQSGILVKPGNSGEMAGAIVRILSSQKMQKEMGQLGYEKYQTEFTVQRMAAETMDVYERITENTEAISATTQPA